MKAWSLKALRFLRILDEKENIISITNACMWVIVVKIIVAPEFTIADLGGLFIGLLAYHGKKMLNKDKPGAGIENEATKLHLDKINNDIKDLRDRVGTATLAAGLKQSLKRD